MYYARVSTAVVLATLTACAGIALDTGSKTSSVALALNTTPDTLKLDCGVGTGASVDAYRVENNAWGRGTLAGWTQCAGIVSTAEPAATVHQPSLLAKWVWDWPVPGGNVKAYPEIIFGSKPGYAATTASLPIILSSLSEATARYEVATQHSGMGNLSFDIWLTNTATPSKFGVPPITHEIMIWMETFGDMSPSGSLIETAMIDGAAYEVFAADNFGYGWRYILYKRKQTQLGSTEVNIKAFLDHAKEKGLVTGKEWLASIEFGNEIINGKGATAIGDYKLLVKSTLY